VLSKCAKAGFDWTLLNEARAKVTEETAELDEAIAAGDTAAMQSELGDLLFAVSSLARFLHIDAEDALRAATARFSQRFAHVEQTAHSEGVDLTSLDVPELVQRWKTAKRALKDKADEKPHKKES
jgi:ATP diphosphatase